MIGILEWVFFEHILLNIELPATLGHLSHSCLGETWCCTSALHKVWMMTDLFMYYIAGLIHFLQVIVWQIFIKNSFFDIGWCYFVQKDCLEHYYNILMGQTSLFLLGECSFPSKTTLFHLYLLGLWLTFSFISFKDTLLVPKVIHE